MTLAFQGIVIYLVTHTRDAESDAVLAFIQKFTLCAVIFSSVELVKSLVARLLSLRVHAAALFDTLEVRMLVPLPRACACMLS